MTSGERWCTISQRLIAAGEIVRNTLFVAAALTAFAFTARAETSASKELMAAAATASAPKAIMDGSSDQTVSSDGIPVNAERADVGLVSGAPTLKVELIPPAPGGRSEEKGIRGDTVGILALGTVVTGAMLRHIPAFGVFVSAAFALVGLGMAVSSENMTLGNRLLWGAAGLAAAVATVMVLPSVAASAATIGVAIAAVGLLSAIDETDYNRRR
jgi:hypothetical protein